MKNKISIIGTAGRGTSILTLNETVYQKMYDTTLEVLSNYDIDNTVLVSGGAAWADHLVVKYKLEHNEHPIELHLPAEFDVDNSGFIENKDGDAGSTANYYHLRFSERCNIDSLLELSIAIQLINTLCIDTYKGFFARNLEVSKSNVVIALTYGDKDRVKDGGTFHTAKNYLKLGGKELWHIDLHDYSIYKNVRI